MKSKTNKGLKFLAILTAVLFVVFAALFVALIFVKGGKFEDIIDVLKEVFSLSNVKELFVPSSFEGINIGYCIASYLLGALALFALGYGVFIIFKRKKASVFGSSLLVILALVPSYAFMIGAKPDEATANEFRVFLFDTLFNGKFDGNANHLVILILTWAYLASIVLCIALPIALFVFCALTASKKPASLEESHNEEEAEEEEADEEAILAEFEEEPLPQNEFEYENKSENIIPEPVIKEESRVNEIKEEVEPEEEEEEEIVYSEKELRDILKDIIKEAVKDEMTKYDSQKRDPQPVIAQSQGLNNGGPIIVQYFNSNTQSEKQPQPTNQSMNPYGYPYPPYPYPYPPYPYPYPFAPQQMTKEEAVEKEKPAPVKQEEKVEVKEQEKSSEELNKKEEQVEEIKPVISDEKPEEKPEEKIDEKPAVIPEEKPVEIIDKTPVKEEANNAEQEKEEPAQNDEIIQPNDTDDGEESSANKIVRIPFYDRIVNCDEEIKSLYNELKNELLSYGLKSRVAANGDTFRLHRKTYCRISVAGKSLKLHLALNPEDYKDSKMPYSDAGDKATYADIPFVFKVKSGLSLRRAKGLIADVCAQDNLIQEDIMSIDWVKEIIANKE